ncbi:MAG: hypothetical protein K2P52_07140 [Campylobacterales bacterium]|nr:hypothetical protein [Campylobacterales bacterium]
MSLSSNSVIHFTNDINSLKGILRDNFKITFCNEKIILDASTIKIQVPMVSFCDIPLSKIKEHIGKYGNYGIGLTKEWAQRKRLNPVLYVETKSYLAESLRISMLNSLNDIKSDSNILTQKQKQVIDILRYLKNYQTDLTRKGNIIPNYRFSDEREWRYVPDINEECEFILTGHKDTISTKEMEKANLSLSNLKLEFEPNDIKYIIIENEDEITDFINILRNDKGKKFSYHDIDRLTTRFITVEQIKTDF